MSENNKDKIFERIMSNRTIEIMSDEEIREKERSFFSNKHLIHNFVDEASGDFVTYELDYQEPDDSKFLVMNGRTLDCKDLAEILDWGIEAGMQKFANLLCEVRSNLRNFLLGCYANRLKLLEE